MWVLLLAVVDRRITDRRIILRTFVEFLEQFLEFLLRDVRIISRRVPTGDRVSNADMLPGLPHRRLVQKRDERACLLRPAVRDEGAGHAS